MRISHILYGGLGGHGSVIFSLLGQARRQRGAEQFSLIFYGIEAPRSEYLQLCRKYQAPYTVVHKGAGWDPRGQWEIFRGLQSFRPAAVMAHSQAALPAALAYRLCHPSSQTLYVEHQSNALKSRSQWVASALAPWLGCRVVLLSSEYRDGLLARLGWLARPGRSCVIPNGIDLERFCPSSRPACGSKVRLGMQARLNATKDLVTLLRALALLPEHYQLLLAGDGEHMGLLRDLSASLGLGCRVSFLGMLDEDRLVDFLGQLDLYVHATHGETMSTAIMQAQACGLAVLASDVPGVRHQIQHGVTGWLVPGQEPRALAEAIASLCASESLRAGLGRQAREWAEAHYSQALMLKGYRRLLAGG